MTPAQTNNNACNDLLAILFIPSTYVGGTEILADLLMRKAARAIQATTILTEKGEGSLPISHCGIARHAYYSNMQE